jgi:hypothetical protein
MAKILIPISNSFFVRNFLRAGFLEFFPIDTKFVFLVPREKIAYYRKEFPKENLDFVDLPVVRFKWAEKFSRECEASMIPTRTVLMMHQFHFCRKGTKQRLIFRLPIFIGRMILWCAGHTRLAREAFRFMYRLFQESLYQRCIRELMPDLLFCPTMVYGKEWILLKEAKRLSVPTIGMTSSWDNLYAKTFLRVKPDRLLLQTELMKATALLFCDFPRARISVTGVPQYDRYFRRPPALDRDGFIRRLGGDPKKKLILYAFSGKVTTDLDMTAVRFLADSIAACRLFHSTQILVRPYPKRDFTEAKIDRLKHDYPGLLVNRSAMSVGTSKDAWEFDETALSFLGESLEYADVVVTACSTFIVEAAVFGKPIVSIGFDFEKNVNYWNSARRFFDWNHLSDIKPLGGVKVAASREDLLSALNQYLEDPLLLSSGRRAIVNQQCGFSDGRSVFRVAEEINRQLKI